MGSDSLDKRLPGTRDVLTNEYQSLYSTPVALFFRCHEQSAKDASAPVVRMNHAGQFFLQDTVAIHIQVTDQHPILIIEEIILFIARSSPQPLHAQPHTQAFVRIAGGYELRYCPRLCI